MEIENAIRQVCNEIAINKGLNTPFDLILTHEKELSYDDEGNLVDIIIECGNPPKVVIPFLFIARTMLADKPNPYYIRHRLEKMLEKLPRCYRTLSNNVPSSLALVLHKDAKVWMRKQDLPIHDELSDNYLEVEYIVRVSDKLSGISFTAISDKSARTAEQEARIRLSRIVLNNESLRNFRHTVMALRQVPKVNDVLLSKVTIKTDKEDNVVTEMER